MNKELEFSIEGWKGSHTFTTVDQLHTSPRNYVSEYKIYASSCNEAIKKANAEGFKTFWLKLPIHYTGSGGSAIRYKYSDKTIDELDDVEIQSNNSIFDNLIMSHINKGYSLPVKEGWWDISEG